MHVVEIFLPLTRNDGTPQPPQLFASVRRELIDRCGGMTAFTRAPAQGLWENDGAIEADRLVIFEAMDAAFDHAWWANYRRLLEERFAQDEVLIRASLVTRV